MGGGDGGDSGAAQVTYQITNIYPGSQGVKQCIMYMGVHLTNISPIKNSTKEYLN